MNRKERRRQQKMKSRRPVASTSLSPDQQGQITASLLKANAAIKAGNIPMAVQLAEGVLALSPDHPDALNVKANCLLTSGETVHAIRLLTKITQLVPDFPQAHFNLGTALSRAGKIKRAMTCLKRAIELDTTYADAHYNLGNALRQCGHLEQAIVHYRQTLDLVPDHSSAATNLASAFLEQGKAQEALKFAQLALKTEPGNRDALAFYAVAATEAGLPDKAAEILSPDNLIFPSQIDTPSGFSDLQAFNTALVDHVLSHPTLASEPHNKATRNGQQTENMALGERGPVAQLQALIGDALDTYLEALQKLSGHPYPPLIPPLSTIDIWGTVLGAQGHQASHMHRAAWVSGVYYAKLPDIMHRGSDNHAGWIEFCRPPDTFGCAADHATRLIEPKEGLLVLFPSYIYHRTIPFESNDKRISIAFDLMP